MNQTPAAVGRYPLGNAHQVELRDGSQHRLIQLQHAGAPSPYLRALAQPGSKRLQVFDLRRLARSLAADIPPSPARDLPGLVMYTLRAIYPNAMALQRAVAEVCELSAEPVAIAPPIALAEEALS